MGGVPLHHEALLHEIPQANMGNFAEYEKKRTKHVLRDPFEDDSASKKLHGFGNPFKVKFFQLKYTDVISSPRMDSSMSTIALISMKVLVRRGTNVVLEG